MKKVKFLGIGLVPILLTMSAQPAAAQDQYRYCQQRAAEYSGYRGSVPNRHLPGGAFEGAARGAAGSVIGGAIFDRNRKQRRRDLRRGAAIGALVGSIKRGHARHEQDRAAREYRLELDACMRGGN